MRHVYPNFPLLKTHLVRVPHLYSSILQTDMSASFTAIDEIRSVRSYFYTGMFDKAIEEATPLVPSIPFAAEYRLRALAEVNPGAVDAEINDHSPFPLQMIKLMCLYRAADESQKENLLAVLDEWISTEGVNSSEISQVVAASVYIASNQLDKAWRWVTTLPVAIETNLEKLALQVHILLLRKRSDLAIKVVQRMRALDDDEVLTSLAHAWVLESSLIPASLHEALSLYTEVSQRCGPSAYILNQIGATYASLGSHKNAFQALKKARDMSKAASPLSMCSSEILRNTMSVMFHRPGSLVPENEAILAKIQAELELSESNLAVPSSDCFAVEMQKLADSFDSAAANYA